VNGRYLQNRKTCQNIPEVIRMGIFEESQEKMRDMENREIHPSFAVTKN
jgi:hypothetical protein